ncbi:MAG: YfiR family protein [Gammaproteobacteria bacterium]|nr:YfiR family protein [Gammaproteobacteria bacterium]
MKLFAGLLLVFALTDSTVLLASSRSEEEIKAAYIYNLARYTQWPGRDGAGAAEPIRLCIKGNSKIATTIAQGISRHGAAHGYQVLNTVATSPGCDLIYYDKAGWDGPTALDSIQRGVLTLGDGLAFIDEGGMIAFVVEGKRLRFAVNLGAARRGGLTLSSQILKLAVEVRDDE